MATRTGHEMEVFVEVAERGGFSAAARELGVPTSTVSRQITRLEERLGVRLLHRSTRQVELTAAGRIYLERAVVLVQAIREAEEAARSLHESPRGPLRVAAPPLHGQPLLSEHFTTFAERYPEVELEVVFGTRFVDLIGERVDVALRAGVLKDSTLVARRLIEVDVVLVASPDYLARRGRPESVEALVEEHDGLISTASDPHWPTYDGARLKPRARLRANNIAMLVAAARRGLGIALAPHPLAAEGLADGTLETVLPGVVGARHGLYLVYPAREHQPASLRAFIAHMTEHIPRDIEQALAAVRALSAAPTPEESP